MNVFKALTALALTATLATTAFAAESMHHQHRDPLVRLQAKLHLSDSQVSQLRPTFAEMRQDHEANHQQFRAFMHTVLNPQQLAKLDAEPQGEHHHRTDLGLSDSQKAQMKGYWEQHRGEMKAEHQKVDSAMMAVLTPDQQAMLKEMRAHWRHHHHHHNHQDGANSQG
jgi:hypothetical protein